MKTNMKMLVNELTAGIHFTPDGDDIQHTDPSLPASHRLAIGYMYYEAYAADDADALCAIEDAAGYLLLRRSLRAFAKHAAEEGAPEVQDAVMAIRDDLSTRLQTS